MSEQNELGGSYVINEAGEKVLVHRTGYMKPEASAASMASPVIPNMPVEVVASKKEQPAPSIKAKFAGWLAGAAEDQQSNDEVEE